MTQTWISVKEAAALMGYSVDYFRRVFCDDARPLVVIHSQKYASKRRVKVLRESVESLIRACVKIPA